MQNFATLDYSKITSICISLLFIRWNEIKIRKNSVIKKKKIHDFPRLLPIGGFCNWIAGWTPWRVCWRVGWSPWRVCCRFGWTVCWIVGWTVAAGFSAKSKFLIFFHSFKSFKCNFSPGIENFTDFFSSIKIQFQIFIFELIWIIFGAISSQNFMLAKKKLNSCNQNHLKNCIKIFHKIGKIFHWIFSIPIFLQKIAKQTKNEILLFIKATHTIPVPFS